MGSMGATFIILA
jgi:hypothetical protein